MSMLGLLLRGEMILILLKIFVFFPLISANDFDKFINELPRILKEQFFIHWHNFHWATKSRLREKCPYSEFFWSVFSGIWTKYKWGKIWTRKNPNVDTFRAFYLTLIISNKRATVMYYSVFKKNLIMCLIL